VTLGELKHGTPRPADYDVAIAGRYEQRCQELRLVFARHATFCGCVNAVELRVGA